MRIKSDDEDDDNEIDTECDDDYHDDYYVSYCFPDQLQQTSNVIMPMMTIMTNDKGDDDATVADDDDDKKPSLPSSSSSCAASHSSCRAWKIQNSDKFVEMTNCVCNFFKFHILTNNLKMTLFYKSSTMKNGCIVPQAPLAIELPPPPPSQP